MSSDVEIGGFRTVKVDKASNEKITMYRVAINNEKEFESWLEDFEKKTQTHWIVTKTFPNHQR